MEEAKLNKKLERWGAGTSEREKQKNVKEIRLGAVKIKLKNNNIVVNIVIASSNASCQQDK